MRLVIHQGLRPQVIEVDRVVVEDAYGNPLQVAVDLQGVIVAETLREGHEAEFNELLRNLGIAKTVVVRTLQLPPISEARFDS